MRHRTNAKEKGIGRDVGTVQWGTLGAEFANRTKTVLNPVLQAQVKLSLREQGEG